jgi:hypothetical protein
MGDGAVRSFGLILCTNSYRLEEVVLLMNVLMIRYELECTIHKKRRNQKIDYMIYIRERSMPLLRQIVTPHMHPSMMYKLGETKAKNSYSQGTAIEVIDLETKETLAFSSIRKAAETLDLDSSNISRHLKQNDGFFVVNRRYQIRKLTYPIPIIQKRTFHANVKAIKRIGPHDKDVVSVIIGSLLGNCSSEILAGNTRFVYIQNIIQKEYIF